MARAVCFLVLFLIVASPAGAQNPAPALTSPDVEYVRNVQLTPPPDGGRQVGNLFYATSRSDVKIFDVSDPAQPVLLSRLPVDTGSRYPVERASRPVTRRTSTPTAASCSARSAS